VGVTTPHHLHPANRHRHDDRRHRAAVNQLALQYLIAWHRDTHGEACQCVQQAAPVVEGMLAALAKDL